MKKLTATEAREALEKKSAKLSAANRKIKSHKEFISRLRNALRREIHRREEAEEKAKDLQERSDKQAKIIQEQYDLRYRGNKIGDILGDISLKDLLEIIMHQRHNMVLKQYQAVSDLYPPDGSYGYLVDLDLDSSPYVCPDGALHLDFRYSPDNLET